MTTTRRGTNAEYNALADFISDNPPTLDNIYTAAADIAAHSDFSRYGYNNTDPEAIAGVMFEIERKITRTFEIVGR